MPPFDCFKFRSGPRTPVNYIPKSSKSQILAESSRNHNKNNSHDKHTQKSRNRNGNNNTNNNGIVLKAQLLQSFGLLGRRRTTVPSEEEG